ncbi:AAA family ATPase [Nakamurella aerolata]|uniref:AAA family ATPase n=1 Tax=Nakamurella aerolata TaxID=1656892 RepID=A0A849ACJ7_9ACTN|nr:AAA family ATPase [Nakamurella aerolata]
MSRVLLSGMSGTGKSTLLEAVARRGYRCVDTDDGDWFDEQRRWDTARITELLESSETLLVQGTVENQGQFYHWFDHIVLLSAPLDVLLARVRSRTNNPYGRTAAERTEIAHCHRTVEPLLRKGCTLELDGRQSVQRLADTVESLLRQPISG